jgi:hypothetical protein
LELEYDGTRRLVEPYSLVFKTRKSDGFGQEYFYVYDQTGGRTSGPGTKSLFHCKIKAYLSFIRFVQWRASTICTEETLDPITR